MTKVVHKPKQVTNFFNVIKKKIEKDNPGFGVHVGAIKIPKGGTEADGLKLVKKMAKKIGACPEQIVHFDSKTKKKIVDNMAAWAQSQKLEQAKVATRNNLKEMGAELKQDAGLHQQYQNLTYVFFIIAN